MADRRCKDVTWRVADEAGLLYAGIKDGCTLAVLMDIRDRLTRILTVLECPNFQSLPREIKAIKRNTAKPKTPEGA